MAHPTRKFFCYRENDYEYKMISCRWGKRPRIKSELSSDYDNNPNYDEPNKITIKFFIGTDDGVYDFEIIARDLEKLSRNFDKVALENWTAPDCISSKEEWGQWSSTGVYVFTDVQFLKVVNISDDYIDIQYHFGDMKWSHEYEIIQMPVDHVDENNIIGSMRPCVTPRAIIEHRSKPRGLPV